MNSIDLYKQLSPAITEELEKAGIGDYKPGDTFVRTDSHYCEVIRITDIYEDSEYERNNVRIKYQKAIDWEATEWKGESTCSISDFKSYFGRAIKLVGKTFAEWRKESLDVIEGKIDIDFYKDQNTDALNNDNALMSRNSKESLTALTNHLEDKKNKAEIIRAFVGYEMEKRKQALEKIKENLYGVVAEFEKKIKKIMRVITTIELYLGIDEELFQIQDGNKASEDEPIQFRQMVLYMDEEIGHWKNGEGLDFDDIKWFDEWLVKDDNYKKLIPEEKGLVVFRPRRFDRKYEGYDPVVKAEMNRRNRLTYLLIRNGECLYRVYTEKITISPRLFPQRKELQELLEKLEGEMNKEDFWSKKVSQEDAEDLIYKYKKRAILMQGLIDRTEVFHPLKKPISIFKLHESEGLVNFIYDDEATLPSGRLPFTKWWKEVNSKIEHGSRVIITGEFGWKRNDFSNRFYLAKNSYDGLRNVPDLPKAGVYEVEEFTSTNSTHYRETEYHEKIKEYTEKGIKFKDEGIVSGKVWRIPDENTGSKKIYSIKVFSNEKDLTIKYMPKAEATSGWDRWDTHKRKHSTRFKIYREDDFVFNYDQISLDDINFYLTSRVDRPNYLEMMPLLETMKEWRLKEIENEKHFARFVFDRNVDKLRTLDNQALQQRIQECIDWWKFKNQWKRPIDKDDTLALRMIERRINSKNYHNLKWEDEQ